MSAEKTPAGGTLPAIDLGEFRSANDSERRRIGTQVDEICRNTGFLIIENHGVPAAVIEDAWRLAALFFDQPLEDKLKLAPSDPACPRGYFPLERETLTLSRGVAGPADYKEAFSCGPLAPPAGMQTDQRTGFFYGENVWPRSPAGFRAAWTACYRAMEELSAQIMSVFAVALNLPPAWFAPYFDHHVSALRGLNYPAVASGGDVHLPRAGAHTDYGSLTILRSDPAVAGLEIEIAPDEWLPAPVITDGFIVNIGDLMARWTNDRWTSTMHRVAGCTGSGAVPRRRSIAFFQNPNYDAVIECLPGCTDEDGASKYPAIVAGDYLRERFGAAVPAAGSETLLSHPGQQQ
jgi:isopenicillin N synthase-like dioxygenase